MIVQATCLLQDIAVLDNLLMQLYNQQRNVQSLCEVVIAWSWVVQAYLLGDEGL